MSSLLVVIFIELFISHSDAYVCESDHCNIDCSIEDCTDVICTNQASSCNITCGAQDCEDSNFYLAASNTNKVTCDGSDACKNIHIQCGLPNYPPNPYTLKDFIGHVNECQFILQNNAIPDMGTIQCINDIDICHLYALSNNDDFKNSNFICQLHPDHAQCIMQCNSAKSCGDTTSVYNCIAAECQCNGAGCNQIHMISSKTSYTDDDEFEEEPSLEPTADPTMILPTSTANENEDISSTNDIDTVSVSTLDVIPTKPPTQRPTRSPNGDHINRPPIPSPPDSSDISTTVDNDESTNNQIDDTLSKTATKSPSISPTPMPITNPMLATDLNKLKTSNHLIWILSAVIFGLFCISCAICICISICCDCRNKGHNKQQMVNPSDIIQSGSGSSTLRQCPYAEDPTTPSYVKHFNNRSFDVNGPRKTKYSFTEDDDYMMTQGGIVQRVQKLKANPMETNMLPPSIKHHDGEHIHLHLPKFSGFATNELPKDHQNHDSMSDIPSIPTPNHKDKRKMFGSNLGSPSGKGTASISDQNLSVYHGSQDTEQNLTVSTKWEQSVVLNDDQVINADLMRQGSAGKWIQNSLGKWVKSGSDGF